MEARDLVVQALVPAIRCEGLDDCVHDLDAGISAGVSQACPDRASLLYSLPPVLHVRALLVQVECHSSQQLVRTLTYVLIRESF